MASMSEIEIIVQHALEDEKTLRLATKVCRSFDWLKQTVIETFLTKLQMKLAEELGETWIVGCEAKGNAILKRGETVTVSKSGWKQSAVGLFNDKVGPSDLNYCIRAADWQRRMGVAWGADLKSKVDERYVAGRATPTYPWWQYFEDPLRDWTTEDSLMLLYDKTEALDQITTAVTRIARLAEPYLDQLNAAKGSE